MVWNASCWDGCICKNMQSLNLMILISTCTHTLLIFDNSGAWIAHSTKISPIVLFLLFHQIQGHKSKGHLDSATRYIIRSKTFIPSGPSSSSSPFRCLNHQELEIDNSNLRRGSSVTRTKSTWRCSIAYQRNKMPIQDCIRVPPCPNDLSRSYAGYVYSKSDKLFPQIGTNTWKVFGGEHKIALLLFLGWYSYYSKITLVHLP